MGSARHRPNRKAAVEHDGHISPLVITYLVQDATRGLVALLNKEQTRRTLQVRDDTVGNVGSVGSGAEHTCIPDYVPSLEVLHLRAPTGTNMSVRITSRVKSMHLSGQI